MSRLIDADALKESIVTETLEKDRGNITRRFCYPCREFFAAIDKAPTIEERKPGRWNEAVLYPYRSCSECGAKMYSYEPANFCPNCGADMRGK